ncbi:MAG: hypothetical protein AAGB34_01325 [Planctomycetota bacterium]
MNEFWRAMLDLETLNPGEAGVRFGMALAIPGWAWLLIVVLALALAIWSYRRLSGMRWVRVFLAGARAALLVLLMVLVAGPELTERQKSTEPDWVIVMMDRSASLTIADEAADSGGYITREARMREALAEMSPALSRIAAERTLVPLGFDGGVTDLAMFDPADPTESLEEPAGRATALGAALEQALAQAAARPLSTIIVLSDGRSRDAPTRDALRRLETERVQIYAYALGSEQRIADWSIESVDVPDAAFAGDVTPVRIALGPGDAPARIDVIDEATGLLIASEEIREGQREATVLATPDGDGEVRWRVRLEAAGDDLIAANNEQIAALRIIDEPMRVLYIDGYPRWEQRYLRNLLLREASITSSGLMLAPDRIFTQEGNITLESLPDSPEAWAEYDAIVLGDVKPDVFTPLQLEQLAEHVAIRGAGVLFIGGPASMPGRWQATPLAPLLPMRFEASRIPPADEPVLLSPAPGAEALGVFRLSGEATDPWPEELSDPDTGWSRLHYAQRLDTARMKPTAEVIATGTGQLSGDRFPLAFWMRYGAGAAAYVGTDEIWRYRYGRGEVYYERFWVQLIRRLGRFSLARTGQAATITFSPEEPTIAEPTRVTIELVDQAFVDEAPESLIVSIRSDDGRDAGTELELRREAGDRPIYAATWVPDEAGRYGVAPRRRSLRELDTVIRVTSPDDELRRPEADHEALATLAETTGGRLLEAADLPRLDELIPNATRSVVSERREALWDSPLALAIVLILLTIEWVGRRLIRLV